MSVFYCSEINKNTGWLNSEESRHCTKVLRLGIGDKIEVVDGKGNYHAAIICEANPKRCEFQVTDVIPAFGKRNFDLHIAIAPTKSLERTEWFIEKATEIGIEKVIPILCKNSERRILKTERLQRKAVSAMKQSKKAYLPEIEELVDFSNFIKQPFRGRKFIAHCHQFPKVNLSELHIENESVLVLIGPEGDFTSEEIKLAVDNGFESVNLSSSRLRTETAAIMACCAINLINAC